MGIYPMNGETKTKLELASHPLRNRRLFYLCILLLLALTAVIILVSANMYFKYKNEYEATQARITEVEQKRGLAQREELKMDRQIENESAAHLLKINFINGLIYRKSFSWIGFLSDLENALPARCYIVSLVPSQRGDLGMEVIIRVASPSLEDLLKLYTQLVSLGFENVLIRSEEQADNGMLISEVSFIYEKHI